MPQGTALLRTTPQSKDSFIHVKVSHGDLRYASYPVVVGHYQGDGIVSAEAVLDRALDCRLTQAYELGLYPRSVDDAAVFLQRKCEIDEHCQGAIVIGLEQVGELNVAKLQASIEYGIVSYVHRFIEQNKKGTTDIGASFLLVGSSAGGVFIDDSIAAILRGVISANKALKNCYSESIQLNHIELIELYLDRAIQAARALQSYQKSEIFNNILSIDPQIDSIKGGYQRVVYSADNQLNWWKRLQITALDNGGICFTSLVKRARAEDTILYAQRTVIDNLLKHSTLTMSSKSGLSATLFELLIPLEFKHNIHTQGNTLLLLDFVSAVYPWELLQQKDMPPIAVQSGLIRQLRQTHYRHSPIQAEGREVLIVGDPWLNDQQRKKFPSLIAAFEEAVTINQILHAKSFSTSLLVGETALSIMHALFNKPYRILHLAGHGVYNFKPDDGGDPISGVVLGEGVFLTPNEVAQMQTVPELVFINCCYLGSIEKDGEGKENNPQPNLLAANLAQQFIKNGVRCVIAAGWALDDKAGKLFAEIFYQELAGNQTPFGEAVRVARQSVYKEYPELNTWGAYQCYGDPSYRLKINSASGQYTDQVKSDQSIPEYSSIQELLSDLNNQSIPFPQVIQKIHKDWLENGELLTALGRSYGLIKQYRKAVSYYEKSYTVDSSQIRFDSVCQCAELTVDWALSLFKEGEDLPDENFNALKRAASQLESLINISAVSEYYALLGKVYRCEALYSHAKQRIHAINKMCECYQQACGGSKVKMEWLSQWMLAALVKNWRSQKNQFNVPEKLISQVKKIPDDQMAKDNKAEAVWMCFEFDFINQTRLNQISAQSLVELESFKYTEAYFGRDKARERLLPMIYFLSEMSRNRRTGSATLVYKVMIEIQKGILKITT